MKQEDELSKFGGGDTIIEVGKDLNSFATTAWAIWYRRNSMRTSGKHIPLQQVYVEVQKASAQFIQNSQPRPPEQTPHSVSRPTWRPPPRSKLKVNFDGAVFREIQRAGVGVIIRDADGRVCASMAESFHLPYSVAAVEVLAATKALQLANDLGFHSIILEGDSLIAIDGLLSNGPSLNEFGHLLCEAKKIAELLDEVKFQFVSRNANKLAHYIARHARHVSEFTVWMEDVPPHLVSVIQPDSALHQ